MTTQDAYPRDPAILLGPFRGGQQFGVTLSYLQASRLPDPLVIHPLLACLTGWRKYLSWNVVEFPALAEIYVDYDDTPTEFIMERFHPATSPKVEELFLFHEGTGWTIRVANRLGINITDVLQSIFTFFASPLYVEELGEMHPREQQYFEKRDAGFFDSFEGYRKSDALLGMTYFNGIRYDPDLVMRRLNFEASNVLVLSLGNC
ncbi:hypothetical protein IAT38_004526 [Cryptococcus sp. DSM 104549]